MKLILIPLLLCAYTFSYAQNLKPEGGGGYEPQHTECVTPAQRISIERMLDSNIKVLRAQGLLPVENEAGKTTATLFNWPLHQVVGGYYYCYGISNYVDHDATYPSHVLDWNCGSRTYDLSSGYNHAGMDIFLWPFYWNMMEGQQVEIIAAAPGTIVGKTDGNPDHDCALGATTDWNSVYIQHADGTQAWYGHMKSGTPTTKAIGATVALGEHLGFVGSSGNSTGPHLHFEVHDASGNVIDPYNGTCSATPSLWNTQKPYDESSVNTLLTHFAAPGFAACPLPDTINARDTFLPGSHIYFVTYYHDQLSGQTTTYSILRPDNSVYNTWTGSSTTAYYAASYWYWSYTIPASEATGKWTFKANFQGSNYTHNFYILNPTPAGIGSVNADDGAMAVYPNPAHDCIYLDTPYPVDAELVNLLGQKVLTVSGAHDKMDISAIPAGLYCLRLTHDGKTTLHKVNVR